MRCIAMLLVKRSPSNGFNQTIMIEGEEGKRKERAGRITSDRMGRELAINWVEGGGIGGWNIFPYFHQHIFHADAQMALTCAAKQRSRFSLFPIFLLFFFFLFWFACTMEEEALKTAKSSAAAANKYAIFLLSCLSGCQPFFAVLRRCSLHQVWVSQRQTRRPADPDREPNRQPILVAGFKLDSSNRTGQTKNSNKALDAYQCNLMSVYICSSFSSSASCHSFFVSSIFSHIPFDWISIWLQFFVSYGWEISDSWMVNSLLGSVGLCLGGFGMWLISLSANRVVCKVFAEFVYAILMDCSLDKLMN